MMKSYLFLIIILPLSIGGCSLFSNDDFDAALKQKLAGTWEENYAEAPELNLIVIREHTFKKDWQYLIAEKHYDTTGSFLGYESLSQDIYKTRDGQLVVDPFMSYRAPEGLYYQTVEELLEEARSAILDGYSAEYVVEFMDGENELRLFPKCGVNQICHAPEMTKVRN